MTARLLWPGYARILRLVLDGDCTPAVLQTDLGTTQARASILLRCLSAMQVIHCSRWLVPEGKTARQRQPVYSFGPGEDVPWPGGMPKTKPLKIPGELVAFVCAVRALMHEPHSGASLAREIGVYDKTATKIIRALRDQGLLYVAGYVPRRNAGLGPPMYAWGPGETSMRKPRAKPLKELWAKHNHVRAQRKALHRTQLALAYGCPPDRRNPRFREVLAERFGAGQAA